nr:unnamed protein product [Leishmania braziliensis]
MDTSLKKLLLPTENPLLSAVDFSNGKTVGATQSPRGSGSLREVLFTNLMDKHRLSFLPPVNRGVWFRCVPPASCLPVTEWNYKSHAGSARLHCDEEHHIGDEQHLRSTRPLAVLQQQCRRYLSCTTANTDET